MGKPTTRTKQNQLSWKDTATNERKYTNAELNVPENESDLYLYKQNNNQKLRVVKCKNTLKVRQAEAPMLNKDVERTTVN